jgi:hypothetical protein
MTKQRGRRAAKSGAYGEQTAESMFHLAGFAVVDFRKYDGGTPTAVRQYPVPHPFRPYKERAGANDFMLFTGLTRVYCQIKNQDSSGTTDEKLSFAFDVARYALTDEPYDIFALVLLGRWWPQNPGIIEWANRKCTEFEMLAGGIRAATQARVFVGPKELAVWLSTLETKTTIGDGMLPFGNIGTRT